MPKLEDARGRCGQGHQEPNSLLQPKHDGSVCFGFGSFTSIVDLIVCDTR